MKNFRGKGDTIIIIGPVGGLTSGQAYMAGDIPVVAAVDIAEGQAGSACCTGVFDLFCKGQGASAGATIGFGDQIYMDAGDLNKDDTNGKPFGKALGVVNAIATGIIKVRLG